jgi:asparagine synthase (glutamine-hydrolysing)
VGRALRLDTEVMLVDDPVKRVDNMTMAWGLEARTPFLDHELVELVAACPPELKLAGGGKGVLKAAARGVVPDVVIDRPKGYFPVPALSTLEGGAWNGVEP